MRILEWRELLDGNQDTVRVTATEPWQSQDLHQLLERSNPRSHQMLGARVLVLAALRQRVEWAVLVHIVVQITNAVLAESAEQAA